MRQHILVSIMASLRHAEFFEDLLVKEPHDAAARVVFASVPWNAPTLPLERMRSSRVAGRSNYRWPLPPELRPLSGSHEWQALPRA
jgi:hypothetical protein